MPRIGTRRLVVGTLAVLTLLGTAACGPSGSSGSSGSSGPSGSSGAPASGANSPRHAAMQAYRQCLTQHGVTFPQHTPGTHPTHTPGAHNHQQGTPPPGVDPQTWSSAQAACASQRPTHAATPAGS